ncbi:hypothetical protein ACFSKY_14445 [Azotobacter chroococcum]|uniref:Uncharacterized protein n=1 Tax=Azotobacter chroococcum TaxID=353 RepID=A0A4R1PIW5_9GAMM|nr:hypothetical protein [Azotobacter chroococcum]TCL27135.1 hypothetical protein EV691_12715 [Azotobacter chroococcum]
MILAIVLFVGFACLGLFVAGVCLGRWMRSPSPPQADLQAADDASLFLGWDGLAPEERKRRLALYRERVLVRSAEQDRAWLKQCLEGKGEVPRTTRDF